MSASRKSRKRGDESEEAKRVALPQDEGWLGGGKTGKVLLPEEGEPDKHSKKSGLEVQIKVSKGGEAFKRTDSVLGKGTKKGFKPGNERRGEKEKGSRQHSTKEK